MDKICAKPNVDIQQRSTLFTQPMTHKRADLFSVVCLVQLNCNLNLANEKVWSLYKLNESDAEILSQISLATNPTVNSAELVIQPASLEYGLYRFVFTVNMLSNYSNYSFRSETDTFIRVVASGLMISALHSSRSSQYGGLVEISKGVNQTIRFDPLLNSYDVDSIVQMTSLSFKYSCQLIENGVESGYPTDNSGNKVDLFMIKSSYTIMANQTCFPTSISQHYKLG